MNKITVKNQPVLTSLINAALLAVGETTLISGTYEVPKLAYDIRYYDSGPYFNRLDRATLREAERIAGTMNKREVYAFINPDREGPTRCNNTKRYKELALVDTVYNAVFEIADLKTHSIKVGSTQTTGDERITASNGIAVESTQPLAAYVKGQGGKIITLAAR